MIEKIIKRILMVSHEICPYWQHGKCNAVDYPLNCNFRRSYARCQVYLEKRINEIEARENANPQ